MTAYVSDPAVLDVVPSATDIKKAKLALPAWKVSIPWLLLVVIGLVAKALASREGFVLHSFALAVDIAFAVVLLAGLLIFAPFIQANVVVMRWNQAYRKLVADPHRGVAVTLHHLTSEQRGVNWQVFGSVLYRDGSDASEHTVDIGASLRPLVTLLAPHQIPTSASRATVWHTADHSVVHVLILVPPDDIPAVQ